MIVILTGFLLGFLGSIHCIGMCGPIAIILAQRNFVSNVIYNLGRVFSYFIFGLLFGFLGSRLVLWNLQLIVSLLIGVFMLFFLLIPRSYLFKILQYIGLKRLIQSSAYLIRTKKCKLGSFLLGTINGFLPCSFVYLAVAGSLSSGDVLNGGLFMLFFGLGTLPTMLGVVSLKRIIGFNLKNKLSRFYPAFALAVGVLLILRGLNLGIPYISPEYKNDNSTNEVFCR